MKDPAPIYNITPFTLLDYPDKVACIIWLAGCNMRCLYCYNPEIVLGKGKINFEKVLEFLKSRQGILDGVVLSGGECTMHSKIIWLIKEIKAMGFLVKLDTNGSRPIMIEHLVALGLVDYIALDFKAMPHKFEAITGSDLFENFEHTLSLLIASGQKFEVRTTVHSDLISEADLRNMIRYLSLMEYTGTYYIQQFVNGVPTIGNLGDSSNAPEDRGAFSGLKNMACSRYHINIVFR